MGAKQPKVPSAKETAGAQAESNYSTAMLNQLFGMVNQRGPDGTRSYGKVGTRTITDPFTGEAREVPVFEETTTLSPELARLRKIGIEADTSLARAGAQQTARVEQMMGRPVNTAALPRAGGALGAAAGSLSMMTMQGLPGRGETIAKGVGNSAQLGKLDTTRGAMPNQIGADLMPKLAQDYGSQGLQQRARVENAMMARMRGQQDIDARQLNQQLADQGITLGSPAHKAAMENQARAVNDARLGVIAAGGQEQALQDQLALSHATFGNNARQATFDNRLSAGQFNAGLQQQDYAQRRGLAEQAMAENRLRTSNSRADLDAAVARGGYAEGVRKAAYDERAGMIDQNNAASTAALNNQIARGNYATGLRNNALQEQYGARSQMLNELASLLGGTQVASPQFGTPGGTASVAGVDYMGAAQNEYQNKVAVAQRRNQALGGWLNIGKTAVLGF